MQRKVMNWGQVVRATDGLSQEAIEAFWDELVLWVDPRSNEVPAGIIQRALKAAWEAVQEGAWAEDGQTVLEYIAVIGLVAIVFFLAATWLLNSGILEQIKTALQIP